MSDSDKAMVECSTVGFKSMADGTIRFTVDVEPYNSDIALKSFSKPGTPCVLAVLTGEVAKKEMVNNQAKKAQPERCPQAVEYHEKYGLWPSNTADAICKQENFYYYLDAALADPLSSDYDDLNNSLKKQLHISSKSEIDTNDLVFQLFEDMLTDYRKFVNQK